jgi:outer membrane protein assembly factor BamB
MRRSYWIFKNVLPLVALLLALQPMAAYANSIFPRIINLPDDLQPEGIAIGRGTSFYAGSLSNGSIYRGSLCTGEGSILVPPVSGRAIAGLYVDKTSNILFAAGTLSGQAFAFDAENGALLATYQLTTDFPSLINDVIVTCDAAYFTDSFQPFFYRVPLGPRGALPDQSSVERIPLGGDFVQVPGSFVFNSNGIEATYNGEWLLIISRGDLYRVDPQTGSAIKVNLGEVSLSFGDGIRLKGRTLYVMRNRMNQIDVVKLARDFTSGTIVRSITDPDFNVPTTIARFGPWLYAVNSQAPYTIVRVWPWKRW